jgi:Uma2 family endonuclease
MTLAVDEKKRFQVGTTGWTVEDLDDPEFERLWEKGRYEIVEGVLTKMPAAYYDSGRAVNKLAALIDRWLVERDMGGGTSTETDLVLNERRIPKVDLMYLTAAQERQQRKLSRQRGRKGVRFGRIVVPPELVLESISLGHEEHDLVVKRAWYAEFGIPNYWILHAYKRTLQCLVLEDDNYRLSVSGKNSAELRPPAFPGLVIPLAKLWG